VIVEEAINGFLEVGDGYEDAALETASGENGEKALDGVQPGRQGRREVLSRASHRGFSTVARRNWASTTPCRHDAPLT